MYRTERSVLFGKPLERRNQNKRLFVYVKQCDNRRLIFITINYNSMFVIITEFHQFKPCDIVSCKKCPLTLDKINAVRQKVQYTSNKLFPSVLSKHL